ncbi:class I SAM-dependent methyltransferase [Pseudorhodoferax sp.]|uniref:class I SAM-dependent methyltransferase n=1 Tax=Pseudorhodoferax sp. TaxID=1993553 RepID=UPI002DD64707|nr:class I SAM-dependent methyltransferase [Pseudorhodoferax sp.]
MINQLHARLHRPEQGWDPIADAYAHRYAQTEWHKLDLERVQRIEQWIGGFEGRRVLDLGSGPGQYAVAFAQRGAQVTCHDVSANYLAYLQRKAGELGVTDRLSCSLGYLDEAPRMLRTSFDLVFNRVCWYYGFGDRSFAKVVFSLISPGGYGYVDTPHMAFNRAQHGWSSRARMWLNHRLAIKIGHPFPPHGRLAKLFAGYPIDSMLVDYSTPDHDRIWLRKATNAP